MQREVVAIRVLLHTGAGSIFGGKKGRPEALGSSLFQAPYKLISKALKDIRRGNTL